MQFIKNSTTLVIAGSWNPAILVPHWVAREAMDLKLDANFPVTIDIPAGLGQFPRYQFEGIDYIANYDIVTFILNPETPDLVNKSVGTAAIVLKLLTHTPVTGFGFNFSSRDDAPSQELLATFTSGSNVLDALEDQNAQAVNQGWNAVIKSEGYLISVNSNLQGDGVVIFSFNVHCEVQTAAEASEKLSQENLYLNIESKVKALLLKLANKEE